MGAECHRFESCQSSFFLKFKNMYIMKSLRLFNAVISKDSTDKDPVIDTLGIIIEPSAVWAKDQILSYYEKEVLDGYDLNKTFHKSWQKIKESTRFQLLVDQILHYMTTYGTDFQSDFIYIPTEKLDIPRVDINTLKFKVIRGYTREELIDKSLSLLTSGVALKQETINDVLSLLHDELDYTFSGKEKINNKEAVVQLAEVYGVLPTNPTEFLRYIVYRTTGESLLIKNDYLISSIKSSTFNPTPLFKKFGLKRLAEIFNRFEPLFLAYKNRSRKTINKISKLSKTYHKPLVENPLNNVTNAILSVDDTHWLENATTFSLLKALNACHTRLQGQTNFMYNVRNGKSWVEFNDVNNADVWQHNYSTILSHLKERLDFTGKEFYVPSNIEYSVPTSEKQFVGNIPMGTRVYGKKLAVGMYWENEWGARDLDLSGVTQNNTKVGWNARYSSDNNSLLYSGDITSAPNGAVEYLYANKGLSDPVLVNMNIYSGNDGSGYKIIVGSGDDISKDYMMNPNNLIFEQRVEAVQKQMILGLFLPKGESKQQSFIVLNGGSGSLRVSTSMSDVSKIGNKALVEEWQYKLSLKDIIELLGGTVHSDTIDENTIDLSIENLEKDTILNLFSS